MKRRWPLLILVTVASLAVVLVLIDDNRVDAPQPAANAGEEASGKARTPQGELSGCDAPVESKPPVPADMPSDEPSWRIVGQLVFRPEFEHELAADLPSAVDSVSVMTLEESAMTQYFGLQWQPDGAVDMPVAPKFEAEVAAADTFKLHVRWRCGMEFGLETNAVRRQNVVDIGRVELAISDALKDDEWLLTGRVTDGANPLSDLPHLRLTTGSSATRIVTNSAGRFLSILKSRNAPRVPWHIDWSTEGPAGSWSHRLSPPVVEESRVVDFGEIVLQAAMLEIELRWPQKAPIESLTAECRITSASVNLSVPIRAEGVKRVPVARGTYEVEVSLRRRQGDERLIASGDRAWFHGRRFIEIGSVGAERVRFDVRPPHLVTVRVETPDGELKAGILEVEFSGEDRRRSDVHERQISGETYTVVLRPGDNAIARASVPGYAPAEAPLPHSADELVLRPTTPGDTGALRLLCDRAEDESLRRVTVEVTGAVFRRVWFDLADDSPTLLVLPSGDYRVEVFWLPKDYPPDGHVLPPQDIALSKGEIRDIHIQGLAEKTNREWSVRCGQTELRGMVPGALYYFKEFSSTTLLAISEDTAWIQDADQRHKWELVEENGAQVSRINLPVRLELTIHEDVAARIDNLPDDLEVEVSFKHGTLTGTVHPTTAARVMQLWTPPGEVRVSVANPSLGLSWSTRTEVAADRVTRIVAGRGLRRVRFSPGTVTETRPDAAEVRPLWGVWNASGRRVGWVNKTRKWLPPGEYVARPAFGPDASREVRFAVADDDIEVSLFEPSGARLGGRVVIPFPDELDREASDRAFVFQSPTEGYQFLPSPHVTFTEEGLLIESLLLDVPLTLRVFLYPDDGEFRYRADLDPPQLTLHSDHPVPVKAQWTKLD